MHGLVNKAVEGFLGDTYGADRWQEILLAADLCETVGTDGFDSLGAYPDGVTERLMNAAVAILGRSRDSLLEDLGTYLVSHPRTHRLRRLLRFGGASYTRFLRSLGDLPGRARLALPDLELPAMRLEELHETGLADGSGPARFRLTCQDCPPGFGMVMLGVLRAMADDYGALVMLDPVPVAAAASAADPAGPAGPNPGPNPGPASGAARRDETILIALHDPAFHQGRDFCLSAGGAGR